MSTNIFEVKNFSITREEKDIVKNVSISIPSGAVHVLMGPNGSGKSSFANALMGHPAYLITSGSVKLDTQEIVSFSPDVRARRGLFLSVQYPQEIPGVTVFNFLKEAVRVLPGKEYAADQFYERMCNLFEILKIDESFAYRNLYEGFSGGERKRFEALQLMLLNPKVAILDEIDSGLDIDALKLVSKGIQYACTQNPKMALLIITHYQRILRYIEPNMVHVMKKGIITQSGNVSLAQRIEKDGYG